MPGYILLSKRPTAAQWAKLKAAGFESVPTGAGHQPCVEDQHYLGGYIRLDQEESRHAEVRAIVGGET